MPTTPLASPPRPQPLSGSALAAVALAAVALFPRATHAQEGVALLPETVVTPAPVLNDARVTGAPRVRPVSTVSAAPAPAPAPVVAPEPAASEAPLPLTSWSGLTPLAGQVTSVSEQQIEELNAQDLASALRRTPGVIISRHNPVGAFGGGDGGTVFIRGLGSSRPGAEIQTAMDGIPRYVGVWTHPILDTLSIDNVERIDVYKGAQPVLYGNMALGVVDLITKRQVEPGYRTELNLGYGSYDTFVQSFEHGGRSGPLDYYVVQSYRESEGHRPFASGELQNYLLRAGYDLNDHWNLNVLYHRTDNRSDDPGDIRTGIRQGSFFTESDFGVIALENRSYDRDGYLKFYWDSGAIDWVDQFNPGSRMNNVDTLTRWDNYGIRARQTYRPWEGGEFVAGFDLDYMGGTVLFRTPPGPEMTFPRETYRIAQPYFLASQRFYLADEVWVQPSFGLRGFAHSVFDEAFGPQAGAVLNVGSTQFHFGYAKGVNYPGVFVDTLANTFQPGNNRQRELSAETLEHFEFGVSRDFGERLTLEAVGFVDRGQDRIAFAPPPPFPPTWRNFGEFETKGVEVSGTWRVLPELALYSGATYLEADPAGLPYTPQWSASFGVSYRFLERFLLSIDGTFVDEQTVLTQRRAGPPVSERIDSYFLLGARLAYDLPDAFVPGSGAGQIYVAGENLTNTDYVHKPGYPMPGANAMVGMKLRF